MWRAVPITITIRIIASCLNVEFEKLLTTWDNSAQYLVNAPIDPKWHNQEYVCDVKSWTKIYVLGTWRSQGAHSALAVPVYAVQVKTDRVNVPGGILNQKNTIEMKNKIIRLVERLAFTTSPTSRRFSGLMSDKRQFPMSWEDNRFYEFINVDVSCLRWRDPRPETDTLAPLCQP